VSILYNRVIRTSQVSLSLSEKEIRSGIGKSQISLNIPEKDIRSAQIFSQTASSTETVWDPTQRTIHCGWKKKNIHWNLG